MVCEEVLSQSELEVLERAMQGLLPCPRCGAPLAGEFVYYPIDEEDSFAGVRLSCECGFVEY